MADAEAALRVSGNGGGKKEVGCYALVFYPIRMEHFRLNSVARGSSSPS